MVGRDVQVRNLMFMYRIAGLEIYVFLLPGQGRVLVFQLMRFPQGENLALQILELICSSAVIQTFTFQLIARGKTH